VQQSLMNCNRGIRVGVLSSCRYWYIIRPTSLIATSWIESKRRAADHISHPILLAVINKVGLIMHQYREELNTPTRIQSIQHIRDNELGIRLLQFIRDCFTLDSSKHSDALAIKILRVSAWNSLPSQCLASSVYRSPLWIGHTSNSSNTKACVYMNCSYIIDHLCSFLWRLL
jgi:hypothetical protein